MLEYIFYQHLHRGEDVAVVVNYQYATLFHLLSNVCLPVALPFTKVAERMLFLQRYSFFSLVSSRCLKIIS